jgi:predicted aspartyl protease
MMIAAAFALFAAMPVTTACGQQLPEPKISWAARQAPVPFELYRGNRVVVRGSINGHADEFILDTGASATTVDRAYARAIGLPPGTKVEGRGAGGPIEAEIVPNVTLEIGGMRFEGLTVAVMDLQPVAQAIGRPMPVVVGGELFNNAAISIDWDARTLTFAPSGKFVPAADAREIKLTRKGPFHYVDVSVAGLPVTSALFDLGNGGTISLPSDYWARHEALAKLSYAESQLGGVGGMRAARAVTLPTATFGGTAFRDVPAILGPDSENKEAAHDSNVGIGMLRQFKVTIDLGQSRLFLTPLASPPAFQRDRAGVMGQRTDDGLKARFVSPQGPAYKAGLRTDDMIVGVNGAKTDRAFFRSNQLNWAQAGPGTPVELALADGRILRFALADYF